MLPPPNTSSLTSSVPYHSSLGTSSLVRAYCESRRCLLSCGIQQYEFSSGLHLSHIVSTKEVLGYVSPCTPSTCLLSHCIFPAQFCRSNAPSHPRPHAHTITHSHAPAPARTYTQIHTQARTDARAHTHTHAQADRHPHMQEHTVAQCT